MRNHYTLALRISAVLWLIWGIIHVLGGVLTMKEDTTSGFQEIAAAVDPSELVADYHPAVGAILNQHGWNMFWAGAVTMVGAFFIWRKNVTSIWVTALVGGLFDIGYFVFVDLGGYGTFFPGSSMTYVSASAILLSFWAWYAGREFLK
jgi:hypothetical protein